jgi:hypothetical protein
MVVRDMPFLQCDTGREHMLADPLMAEVERALDRAARHGRIYEVVGVLAAPDGRKPVVRVVWMIRYGEAHPRLVTTVP